MSLIGTIHGPKDHYGAMIQTGAQVAFNYQGMVRQGYIRSIKECPTNYTNKRWTFVIAHKDNLKLESKITKPQNLTVIIPYYN